MGETEALREVFFGRWHTVVSVPLRYEKSTAGELVNRTDESGGRADGLG